MANIGGISFHVNAEISDLVKNLDSAKNYINKFSDVMVDFNKKINDIKFEGIIKKDFFKSQAQIIKSAKSEIESMASSFRSGFENISGFESIWAKKSIANIKNVANRLNELKEELLGLQNVNPLIGNAANSIASITTQEDKGKLTRKDFLKLDEKGYTDFIENLKKFKGTGLQVVDEFFKSIQSRAKVGKDQFIDELGKFSQEVDKQTEKLNTKISGNIYKKGIDIARKGFQEQGKIELGQTLEQAGDDVEARKRQENAINKLLAKEKMLIADIVQGNNVQANKNTLLNVYNQLIEKGVKLSKEQLDYLKAYNVEKNKEAELNKRLIKDSINVKESKDAIVAAKVQNELVQLKERLNAQNDKALEYIRQGSNVQANENILLQNNNIALAHNIELEKNALKVIEQINIKRREQLELEKYRNNYFKDNKEQLNIQQAPDKELLKAKKQFKVSDDNADAYKRQEIQIQKLLNKEQEYLKNIAVGNNVLENKNKLLGVYNQLTLTGYSLRSNQIEQERILNAELGKDRTFADDIKNSKLMANVWKEQRDIKRSLTLENNKAIASIQAGANIEEAENVLINNNNKAQKWSIELDKETTDIIEKIILKRKQQVAVEKQLTEGKKQLSIQQKREQELADSSSDIVALKKRDEVVRAIIIKTNELNTNIKNGISVQESENALVAEYNKLISLGVGLNEAQIATLTQLTTLRKAQTYNINGNPTKEDQDRKAILDYELAQENSSFAAKKRLEKAIYDLDIAEKKLLEDKKLGIKVDKDLENNYKERIRLGQKLNEEQKKLVKDLSLSVEDNDKGFLSREWFKQRAGWFIQLRALWGAYRLFTESWTGVKDLERSFVKLKAITQATNKEFISFTNAIKQSASVVAVPISEMAEGMIKLGQAGITGSDISKSIKPISELSLATGSSISQVTDLMTSLTMAWKEMETSFDSEADMMSHFSDILANTVNKSKVEIEGLGTALQYITGLAPQLDIKLQDISAAMGVMANRGIKMSKIGTGLQNLLAELINPTERFKEELYSSGLTMDDVNIRAIGFIKVLKNLDSAGFDVGNAFTGMNRRTATALTAMLGMSGEIDKFSKELTRVGTVSDMAGKQSESLANKMILLKNNFVIFTKYLFDYVAPTLKMIVSGVNDLFKSFNSMDNGFIQSILELATLFASAFSVAILIGFGKELKILWNTVKKLGSAFAFAKSPIGAFIYVVTSLLILLNKYIDRLDELKEKTNRTSAAHDEAKDKLDDFTKAVQDYNAAVDQADKDKILATNEDLKRLVLEAKYFGNLEERVRLYGNELERVLGLKDQERRTAFSDELKTTINRTGAKRDEFGNIKKGSMKFKDQDKGFIDLLMEKPSGEGPANLVDRLKDFNTFFTAPTKDEQIDRVSETLLEMGFKIENYISKLDSKEEVTKQDIENFLKKEYGARDLSDFQSLMIEVSPKLFEEYNNMLTKSLENRIEKIPELNPKTKYIKETALEVKNADESIASGKPFLDQLIETNKSLKEFVSKDPKFYDALKDMANKDYNEFVKLVEDIQKDSKDQNYYVAKSMEMLNIKNVPVKGSIEHKKVVESAKRLEIQANVALTEKVNAAIKKSELDQIEIIKEQNSLKARGIDLSIQQLQKYGLAADQMKSVIDQINYQYSFMQKEIEGQFQSEVVNARGQYNEKQLVSLASGKRASALSTLEQQKQGDIDKVYDTRLGSLKQEIDYQVKFLELKQDQINLDDITTDELLQTRKVQEDIFNLNKMYVDTVYEFAKIRAGADPKQLKQAELEYNFKVKELEKQQEISNIKINEEYDIAKAKAGADPKQLKQAELEYNFKVKELEKQQEISNIKINEEYDIAKAKAGGDQRGLKQAKLEYTLSLEELKRQKETNILKTEEEHISHRIALIDIDYAKQKFDIESKIKKLQIDGGDHEIEILDYEKDILNLDIKQANEKEDVYKKLNKQSKELDNILEKELAILEVDEKRKRANEIVYDYYKSMSESAVSYHKMMVDSMVNFSTGFAEGIGSMFADFTMGFQTQQQEVVDLEGSIKELEQERNEITDNGTRTLFNEEESKRLQEINSEIRNMNGEINDLENPVKNLKESFKDFFKSLIDGINEAIAKWLAWKLVMAGVNYLGNAFAPASMPIGGDAITGWNNPMGVGTFATGGIMPNIKSFKRFASGGITNGLSFAMLGDNKSGKELVIPSENISDNSVSGYVRDSGQQAIYIANVLSEADIQNVMAKGASGQIVINHVLRDIDSRGPVFRQIGRS